MSRCLYLMISIGLLSVCQSLRLLPQGTLARVSRPSINQYHARAFSISSEIDAELRETALSNVKSDEVFMRLALRHAQHAFRDHEVPIGAVLVDSTSGTVISAARNQVESDSDASSHAEILCLRRAAALRGNWRLLNCTLYTTLEPCMMCLGAMHAFRIDRLVYAAADSRVGSCGSWLNLTADAGNAHPIHTLHIAGGVLADDAADMLRRFFKNRRESRLLPRAGAATHADGPEHAASSQSTEFLFNRGAAHI